MAILLQEMPLWQGGESEYPVIATNVVMTSNSIANNTAHDIGVFSELMGRWLLIRNPSRIILPESSGGGVWVVGSNPVILSNNIINNNTAQHKGGAWLGSNNGTINLTNNIITHNIATQGDAGGIWG